MISNSLRVLHRKTCPSLALLKLRVFVCLSHMMLILLMFVALGLHQHSFQFAYVPLDAAGKPGMLGDRANPHTLPQ